MNGGKGASGVPQRLISFQAMTRGGLRTERVYMNYPRPSVLHDYRFIGDTYRGRERIKKQQVNMIEKFKALPDLEKNAILERIWEEFNDNS